MPFTSINPTNPRTNLWNFGKNCSAFRGGWKTQFFWVCHFFCFIPIKISQHLYNSKNFSKFWWLLWFPENFWCAYTIKIYGKYLKIQNSFTSLSSLTRFPFSLPLSMSWRTSWNNLPIFRNVCKIWIKMADRSPLIFSPLTSHSAYVATETESKRS